MGLTMPQLLLKLMSATLVEAVTDIAMESADIVLMEDLTRIPYSIRLSKKYGIIKQISFLPSPSSQFHHL